MINIESEPRIGDAEREAAISSLSEHFTAGRLSHEEFDERSDQVLAARTQSQISALFADLPSRHQYAGRGGPSAAESASRDGRREHSHHRGMWKVPWLPVILIAIGLTILLQFPVVPLVILGLFALHWVRRGSGPRRAYRHHW